MDSQYFDDFFIIYLYITYVISTVQHGDPVTHTCIHSFFSHYVFHHKWLDIVPSATQQHPTANPSQRQHSASIYPKLPVPPTPPPFRLGNHRSILQVHDFLFCGKVPLCHILDSRYKWYHMVFVFFWLNSLRMRVSSSIHVAANGIILFFFMA